MKTAKTLSSGTSPLTIAGGASSSPFAGVDNVISSLRIINMGSTSGFYSFDGGIVYHYLPANATISDDEIEVPASQVKILAGASGLSGLYISALTDEMVTVS